MYSYRPTVHTECSESHPEALGLYFLSHFTYCNETNTEVEVKFEKLVSNSQLCLVCRMPDV